MLRTITLRLPPCQSRFRAVSQKLILSQSPLLIMTYEKGPEAPLAHAIPLGPPDKRRKTCRFFTSQSAPAIHCGQPEWRWIEKDVVIAIIVRDGKVLICQASERFLRRLLGIPRRQTEAR